MVNVEQVIYDLLSEKVPEIDWSGVYSQTDKLNGAITQLDNSIKISTSSSLEHISSVACRVTFWALTPEELFPLEEKINNAIMLLGLRRNSPQHMTDERIDNTVLYRSVTLFSGVYDNIGNRFYFK